jgi:hypothetical protein
MTHAWTHAWCKSPARDEAVRAAEDGRTGPLPTLEECIAAVTERMSVDAGGEESSQGLRTERITLEVTHDLDARLSDWIVEVVDESLGLMESVRVVEEAHFDDLAQVVMERDAAIRERDELRTQVKKALADSDKMWSCCLAVGGERDAAKARVAELEAASGGGEGEPVAWGISNPGHPHFGNCEVWTVRTTEEIAKAVYSAAQGWQHFPLYRAPPQPRGWLTGEEREAVHWAADAAYDKQHPAEDTLRNILARSTPPEVVLPEPVGETKSHGPLLRKRDVIAALAAAGVEVKEVGK